MKINSNLEMREVAIKLLHCYSTMVQTKDGALLLLLKGDLGSGKTTFVQALAGELGIRENVTSPTFVIQKQYEVPQTGEGHPAKAPGDFERLVHIDAYRLNTFSELEALGWSNFLLDSKSIVALEWPERVAGVEKHERKIDIEFLHVRENIRNVLFGGKDTLC
jgi:tRNA threonylcarbamoyladenosine biosynthesis protein TsaE